MCDNHFDRKWCKRCGEQINFFSFDENTCIKLTIFPSYVPNNSLINDWILFNLLDFGIRNLWWIMGIKFTLTLQTKKVFATRIINLFTYVEIQLVHVSCKILSCSKLWTWRPKNLSSVYSSNVRKQNYILLVDNSLNHVLCKEIFVTRDFIKEKNVEV